MISGRSGVNFDNDIRWTISTNSNITEATQSISPNGTYYRKVYVIDEFGHEKVSEERMFTMESTEISCVIY